MATIVFTAENRDARQKIKELQTQLAALKRDLKAASGASSIEVRTLGLEKVIKDINDLKSKLGALKFPKGPTDQVKNLGETVKRLNTDLGETEKNLQNAFNKTVGGTVNKDLTTMSQKLGEVRTKTKGIGQALERLSAHKLSAVTGKMQQYQASARQSVVETVTFARELQSLAGLAITLSAVNGIRNFITVLGEASVNLTRFVEGVKLLHTAPDALQKVSSGLEKVANKYGIAIDDMRTSYIRLGLTFKKSGATISQQLENMTKLARAFRGSGISADAQGRALKAIEQMLSKGTIQAEELKQQLGDAIPNVVKILADEVGVSVSTLFDMMKKGLLDSSTYVPALINGLDKVFGPASVANANSLGAAIIRTSNAMVKFQNEILKTNPGIFISTLKEVTHLLENPTIQKGFGAIGSGLDTFMSKLLVAIGRITKVAVKISSVLSDIITRFHLDTIIGPLTDLIITLGLVSAGFAAFRLAMTFIIGPMSTIGAGIINLIGYIRALKQGTTGTVAALEKFATLIEKVGVGGAIKRLGGLVASMKGVTKISNDGIAVIIGFTRRLGTFVSTIGAVGRVITSVLLPSSLSVNNIFKLMSTQTRRNVLAIKLYREAINGLNSAFRLIGGGALFLFISGLEKLIKAIDTVRNGISNLKTSIPSLVSNLLKGGKGLSDVTTEASSLEKGIASLIQSITKFKDKFNQLGGAKTAGNFAGLSKTIDKLIGSFKFLNLINNNTLNSLKLTVVESKNIKTAFTLLSKSAQALRTALEEINAGTTFIRMTKETRQLVAAFDGIDNFRKIVGPFIHSLDQLRDALKGLKAGSSGLASVFSKSIQVAVRYSKVLTVLGAAGIDVSKQFGTIQRALKSVTDIMIRAVSIGEGKRLGLITQADIKLVDEFAKEFKLLGNTLKSVTAADLGKTLNISKLKGFLTEIKGSSAAMVLFNNKFGTSIVELEKFITKIGTVNNSVGKLSSTLKSITFDSQAANLLNKFGEIVTKLNTFGQKTTEVANLIKSSLNPAITELTKALSKVKATQISQFAKIVLGLAPKFNQATASAVKLTNALNKMSGLSVKIREIGNDARILAEAKFSPVISSITRLVSKFKELKQAVKAASEAGSVSGGFKNLIPASISGEVAKLAAQFQKLKESSLAAKAPVEDVKKATSGFSRAGAEIGAFISRFKDIFKTATKASTELAAVAKAGRLIGRALGPITVGIDIFNELSKSGSVLRAALAGVLSIITLITIGLGLMAATPLGALLAIAAAIASFYIPELVEFLSNVGEKLLNLGKRGGRALGVVNTEAQNLKASVQNMGSELEKTASVFAKNYNLLRKGTKGYKDFATEVKNSERNIKALKASAQGLGNKYNTLKTKIIQTNAKLREQSRALSGSKAERNAEIQSIIKQTNAIKGNTKEAQQNRIELLKKAAALRNSKAVRKEIAQAVADNNTKLRLLTQAHEENKKKVRAAISVNKQYIAQLKKSGDVTSKTEKELQKLAQASGKSAKEAAKMAKAQSGGLATSIEAAAAYHKEEQALRKKLAATKKLAALEKLIGARNVQRMAALGANAEAIQKEVQQQKNLNEQRRKTIINLTKEAALMQIRKGNMLEAAKIMESFGFKEKDAAELVRLNAKEIDKHTQATLKNTAASLEAAGQQKAADQVRSLAADNQKLSALKVNEAVNKQVEALRKNKTSLLAYKDGTKSASKAGAVFTAILKEMGKSLFSLDKQSQATKKTVAALTSMAKVSAKIDSTKISNFNTAMDGIISKTGGLDKFIGSLRSLEKSGKGKGITGISTALNKLKSVGESLAKADLAENLTKINNALSGAAKVSIKSIAGGYKVLAESIGTDPKNASKLASTIEKINKSLVGTQGVAFTKTAKGFEAIINAINFNDPKKGTDLAASLTELNTSLNKAKPEKIVKVAGGYEKVFTVMTKGGSSESFVKAVTKLNQQFENSDPVKIEKTANGYKLVLNSLKSGEVNTKELALAIASLNDSLNAANPEKAGKVAGGLSALVKSTKSSSGKGVKEFASSLRTITDAVNHTEHTKLIKTATGYSLISKSLHGSSKNAKEVAKSISAINTSINNVSTGKLIKVGDSYAVIRKSLSGGGQSGKVADSVKRINDSITKVDPVKIVKTANGVVTLVSAFNGSDAGKAQAVSNSVSNISSTIDNFNTEKMPTVNTVLSQMFRTISSLNPESAKSAQEVSKAVTSIGQSSVAIKPEKLQRVAGSISAINKALASQGGSNTAQNLSDVSKALSSIKEQGQATAVIQGSVSALQELSNNSASQEFQKIDSSMKSISEVTSQLQSTFPTLSTKVEELAGKFSGLTGSINASVRAAQALAEAIRNIPNPPSVNSGGNVGAQSRAVGGIVGNSDAPIHTLPTALFENAPHFAQGTANTGNFKGGMAAILHANEAVIPLSGGRTVPVEIKESNKVNNVTYNTYYEIHAEDVDSFNRSKEQIEASRFHSMSNSFNNIR